MKELKPIEYYLGCYKENLNNSQGYLKISHLLRDPFMFKNPSLFLQIYNMAMEDNFYPKGSWFCMVPYNGGLFSLVSWIPSLPFEFFNVWERRLEGDTQFEEYTILNAFKEKKIFAFKTRLFSKNLYLDGDTSSCANWGFVDEREMFFYDLHLISRDSCAEKIKGIYVFE